MSKKVIVLVKATRSERSLTVEVFDIATIRELRTISQEVNARIKEIRRQRGEK